LRYVDGIATLVQRVSRPPAAAGNTGGAAMQRVTASVERRVDAVA
jgi:hypothetical protein